MKKLLSLVLALLALTLPTLSLAEETPANEIVPTFFTTSLTVHGSATVTLEPDMAQVSVGVVTQAETVAEAASANASTLNSVIDALKAAGLTEEDMVTEYYTVSPQYDYQYGSLGNTQSIISYQVSNTLRLTIRQLDALGQVLDTAMQAGANECYGISFLSSQAAQATDQAMTLAIAEGQRKAELMAQAAGMQLVRLVSVSESHSSYHGVTYDANVLAKSAATTILANGLDFTASVEMTFEMQ